MKDAKFFLDTNIIAYTFDQDDPQKQTVAQILLEEALRGKGCISYQVIQEFFNIALRKFNPAMSTEQAQQYLQTTLFYLCQYYPDENLYRRALSIQNRWRFSWYDSLIITAALELDCKILYSEDLQHKQEIETLMIINPFKADL